MKFEFSAGGVVYKNTAGKLYVLVCQHSQHHGWVFPKGLIGDHVENEGKEETAIREVEEETGVLGKIIKPLNPVDYWYVLEGEKTKKTVYYFLMTVISEDISKHDKEMENVEWLPLNEVENRLTYPSDKKVWQEARQLIANEV
jgi:8-oxo-dGTP pyrophosphatase MutT (NUDIX family)